MASARSDLEAGNLRTAFIHISNVLQVQPSNVEARTLAGEIALLQRDPQRAWTEFERARSLGAPEDRISLDLADALIQLDQTDSALDLLGSLPQTLRDGRFWVLQGEALLKAGRLDEASDALKQSHEEGAETTRALLAEAEISKRRGQADEAEALLTRAVERARSAREEADAHQARGVFYLAEQRLEMATEDLGKAAGLFSGGNVSGEEISTLAALVQASLSVGDESAAARWAEQLSTRAPDLPVSDFSAGLVAYNSGRFDEAITLLQRAVNRAPNNPRFLTVLGAAQLGAGNTFQAEQELKQALDLDPRDPVASKLLAEARIRQERPEAALDALRPLADLGPDPQRDVLAGLASIQRGEVDRGIAYLEEALAQRPDNEVLRLELARAYLLAGRKEDAQHAIEAVPDGPRTVEMDAALILAKVQSGDSAGARESISRIIKNHPDDPHIYVEAATFYQLMGDKAAAVDSLRTALQKDKNFVPARIALAGLAAQRGESEQAMQQLQAVLEVQPGNPSALAGLAQLAVTRHDFAEAERLLGRAVASAPAVPMRLMLARLYLQTGKLTEAEAQVDAAAKDAADSLEVRIVRGLLALASKQYTQALSLLKAVEEERPGRPEVALALAQAQTGAGDLVGARDTLQIAAAQHSPASLPVRSALGAAEIKLGRVDAALKVAGDMQVDFPQQAAGYLLEGDARVAQRKYDSAAESYGRAFEQAPDWVVLGRWALASQLAGRPGAVEPTLMRWVDTHPDHLPAKLLLGALLQDSGRKDAAIGQFESALRIAPDNVVALNNLAWLYHEKGRVDAIQFAQKAARLAPENAAVLDTLGWILTQRGQNEEGLEQLQKATRLAPRIPDIEYHLAFALARVGREDEAREVLRAALEESGAFAARDEAEALFVSLR
jgi:putative PEP-CTERM system TPR-repeat lipoprotein